MTAWMLSKGILIQTGSLWDPTHINPGSWGCVAGLDQGDGARIMSWYTSQNELAASAGH